MYEQKFERFSLITNRYYGIYDYYDNNGNLRQVKSTGFNLSEDAVPKSVTIYYNEKLNESKVKQKLSWLMAVLISMSFIVRSESSFISNSEVVDGYLSEVIYDNSMKRYCFIRNRYYGVYKYYDDKGNAKRIKSTGFNLSEDSVPETVKIYYNKKLNQAKIKKETSWLINEYSTIITVFIFGSVSLIFKKPYI